MCGYNSGEKSVPNALFTTFLSTFSVFSSFQADVYFTAGLLSSIELSAQVESGINDRFSVVKSIIVAGHFGID